MSFTTTAPAPTKQKFPIFTFSLTVELLPIWQAYPTVTFAPTTEFVAK